MGATVATWSKIAIVVALVGVAVIAIATAGDSVRVRTFAQGTGVNAAASCGTGNPLHGRTQGVVDAIVERLRSDGVLNASADCSDVTNSHLSGIRGELDVSGRGLTQLRANDFLGLSGFFFWRVNLNDNEIVTLPANAFTGMSQLQTLKLRNNKVTTIESGAFNGTGRLSTIELHNNRISTLAANAFSGIRSTNQVSLDMPGNEISSLPSNIFSSLRLRRLNLSDNYLKSNQLGFLTTTQQSLGNLYLDSNLLTSDGSGPDPDLPTNIFGGHGQFAFQRNLRLNGNKIEELPSGVFNGMSGIKSIDLSDNRITRLQAGALNGLTWVASNWDGGVLKLTGNPIASVEVGAFNGGACASAPSWMNFTGTNCIHYLHLDDTVLESLPAGAFSGMNELRQLHLNGGRLTTIPSALYSGLSKITTVSLHGNRIVSLPAAAFMDLQDLGTLDLRGNMLTSLPTEVFSGLPTHDSGANMGLLERPTSVDVRGNSLGATAIAMLTALFPAGHDIKTGALPTTTPRTAGPDDGMRETAARCGASHILTGRTAEVVYSIMRGAYGQAGDWSALTALNHPMYNRYWDSTLAAHQTRYGSTPSAGDPPAVYPALCNLMTANDLLRVSSLSVNTNVKSLESDDFSGLSNLVSLSIYSSTNGHGFRELPGGIFDGLTKLRALTVRGSNLMSLRARVFNRLSDLRTLDLSYNLLTTLPSGVFDQLTQLHTLSLNDNRLSSLPSALFAKLTDLGRLWMQRNDLDAEDIPAGTFNGLSRVREISLRSNNFDSLYIDVFVNQGLSMLKTLRISERTVGRSTDAEFAEFEQTLPSLVRLDRAPGVEVVEPTATPTITPTPTVTPTLEPVQEPIVTRIEPLVRSLTITGGTEVRLSFALYNYRGRLDNNLSTHRLLRIVWTTSDGGSFSESPSEGANGDGEVNDREVVWHAPAAPGRHTVMASLHPPGSCNGDARECTAEFHINVTGVPATLTPGPTPCATLGLVPSTVFGVDGNTYAPVSPRDGGEFTGDGVWITASRGALTGCGYIGIRGHELPGQAPSTIGHWATDGPRYAIDVVDPSGNMLPRYTTVRPVDVCVPLPDRFRSMLSDLRLLGEAAGGMQELTSKVRRHPTEGFKVCGAVSEFPAVVVAASRGLSSVTALPTPTPAAEVPPTGGDAPNGAYVMLAFVLGVLVLTGIGRIWQDN